MPFYTVFISKPYCLTLPVFEPYQVELHWRDVFLFWSGFSTGHYVYEVRPYHCHGFTAAQSSIT
jgi:hypothetical protein